MFSRATDRRVGPSMSVNLVHDAGRQEVDVKDRATGPVRTVALQSFTYQVPFYYSSIFTFVRPVHLLMLKVDTSLPLRAAFCK